MNSLSKEYADYVKGAVDRLVLRTGMAVASTVLTQAGIADRKQLRKLVNMGVLNTIPLSSRRRVINGYYTGDVLPNTIKLRKGKEHAKLHQDSEGRRTVGEGETDRQEAVREV